MPGGKGGSEQTQTVQQGDIDFAPFTDDVIKNLYNLTRQNLKQPLHPLQQEGLTGMEGLARQGGQLLPGAQQALQGTFGTAGDLMSGQFVNPALAETQRIAMGGDVGTNPYLEAQYERASRPLLDQLTQTVNPNIDIGAASQGRTGGGMHALLRNQAGEQTGQALTDLATGIYGGAYESDQARRMGALGQLGGLGQQDVANRLAGGGLALQAGSMAPGLDAARFADAERLYNLGQTRQQAPYQIGQQYANFLGSLPSTGGSTSTAYGPGTNPFAEGLAGGLGGAQIGAEFGPWGAGIGGGAGALAGLLSDPRTKENAEPVGISMGGNTIWKYNYRHDPSKTTHLGMMADEVLATQPEAVFVTPDLLLGIDYSKVG